MLTDDDLAVKLAEAFGEQAGVLRLSSTPLGSSARADAAGPGGSSPRRYRWPPPPGSWPAY